MNVYERLSDPLALIVFVITLFLPVIVGLVALKRTRSQSDFFVGGRAMNKLVVALSAVSSGRSSWLVLGVSGMAYARGTGALWAVAGYTIVELIQFLTVGQRLRDDAQRYDSITLLDWFESKFPDSRRRIRVTGALIIGVFLTAYVAAQLNGGAKTLEAALQIPFWTALLAAAVLIVVYMLLGGYIAVAYNDVVRATIMLVALLVLPIVGLVEIGGFAGLAESLRGTDPGLVDPFSLGVGALIGFLGIGLGSPGQPHILVRYMSIDDPKNIRAAGLFGFAWNVVLGAGAVFVGLVGRALVPAVENLPEQDPEMAYLVLSADFFAPALYGLLVGGIFAAILSTADSQLLVVSSTVVRDVWEKVVRSDVELDEQQRLKMSRMVVLLAGIAAVLLAWGAQGLVFWLVLFAWGGLGAAIGPAVILGLFWRRTTASGVVAGMITGAIVTIVWRLWLRDPTGLYELIPGFAAATIAVVLVSLLSRPRGRARV
ncbi:MAG TPA: sodium/proline symporter [Candidatus Krumholzibacteria bacterium]|nr:sodium/proline symporter [Candidatus Krumholzibacteria bacterium]